MNRAAVSNMQSEWNSWEHLIRDDIKRLENRIQACYSGMACFGVGQAAREQFVMGKVVEIIKQVTEVRA